MRKNLLAIFVGLLLFTACEKDSDNEKYNPDHPIYINGVDKANKNIVYTERLSVEEIVRIDSVCLRSEYNGVILTVLFEFSSGNIDTLNNRFIMRAGYIDNGTEGNIFFEQRNYYLTRHVKDTVGFSYIVDTLAYVPNYQITDAKAKIDSLFPLEKWSEIYDIFNNAFTFIPCTGAELRELEKQGLW